MATLLCIAASHLSAHANSTVSEPEIGFKSCPAPDYVKVYKYDGSIQCASEGTSVETKAQALIAGGIDVICAQEGHDGLSRIALCGETTGHINVYKIHGANLNDAEALGFQPVSTLTEYHDQPCEAQ